MALGAESAQERGLGLTFFGSGVAVAAAAAPPSSVDSKKSQSVFFFFFIIFQRGFACPSAMTRVNETLPRAHEQAYWMRVRCGACGGVRCGAGGLTCPALLN
eukprot:COSAG02_NODE_3634_length_6446_cov_3.541201_4_plen_102_part_00